MRRPVFARPRLADRKPPHKRRAQFLTLTGGGGGGGPTLPVTWDLDYDVASLSALADGDTVTTWANTGTQAGGALIEYPTIAYPRYEVDAFGAGLHGVRFGWNGTSVVSTALQFPLNANFPFTDWTAAEMMVVWKTDNDPEFSSGNGPYQLSGTSTASHYPFSDGNIYDAFGTDARKSTGNPTPALTSPHIYNVVSQSGEWTSRINGTQHFTTATNTYGIVQLPAALGVSSGNYFRGRIARLLLRKTVLTTEERAAMLTYLQTVYGLA